ncbi:MAG: cell division protein FtsA [Verrucomicrobia bacterium]|nr:cell division protein FtsA [Verrucomicrobiota bacterium]MBT4900496.1 cell division protein FtsA [Verrucomicrobiota bacterium]
MYNSQIIVGLEIGTSKVSVAVGEVSENKVVNIIGIGQAKSRGVRKGEIIDVALAEEDVRNAIVEAEQVADVEIRSVFLGVTGSHIRGFNNTGVHPVVSADREISTTDIQDVIKNARAINLPTDHSVVHSIRQHFRVDGQDGVQNPEGMLGAKIEVDVHVVSGRYNRLQNPIRLVSGLHLEVENISSSALASSLAVLGTEQKELGTLVIDLGAGVTEYAVYSAGVIKHTGVLAVGGDHVSNDLAYGLKVPLARAEQLKIDHGSALIDPEAGNREIDLSDDSLIPGRQVNLGHMQKIMSMRLRETFELIARDIGQAGLIEYLRAGVVLCGGGARTSHITGLARDVFNLPVAIGRASTVSGIKNALDEPEFATSVGLIKFGVFQSQANPRRARFGRAIRQQVAALFGR